jgi:hypothetical protein
MLIWVDHPAFDPSLDKPGLFGLKKEEIIKKGGPETRSPSLI